MMDEKKRDGDYTKHNEQADNIPAGVFEDVQTINNDIEEMLSLKAAKRYDEAADKAKIMLEKKVLPPAIKQQVILESVEIYLETAQYTKAQELLQHVKDMSDLTEDLARDLQYRILHIGVVKELLRKNNKQEMPWSMLPRLLVQKAEQEMDKIMPLYKVRKSLEQSQDEIYQARKELGLAEEPSLSRDRIRTTDKENEQKDHFWIAVVVVVVLAVGIGFMLAMSYLSRTAEQSNATLNIQNPSVQQPGQDSETNVPSIDLLDPDNNQVAVEPVYEIITTEASYVPGEWYFIQAGAYSNAAIAEANVNKFINAGFYAEQISREPILLMVFAGSSQGQADRMLGRIKEHQEFVDFSMYVRSIQAKSEYMMLEGKSIDEEALSLFGERMTGYLRLVSDTSLYLLEETDADRRSEAIRELMNTSEQIREQLDIILAFDDNQEYQVLQKWHDELKYFTNRYLDIIEARDSFNVQLQEHLFELLVPQIW
ncbi:SPOR domain-containing protein [Desulfuribacillus alkaliarsenatis]|uniref:SPOR domain-containing protein n=1 Tax=Desulfuribacillus alkaliarsenatis TaxID=766136 RepID=A0A1E5G579_9FIRM|nr:SPOR domain-containing protein [Desulfuribacillus alkaliarsenatis]OEF98340.1 hypothetical protein BHF68_01275 [Desulfuribacillus alkaliarsenatis]